MPTKQQGAPKPDAEAQGARQRDAALGGKVLQALGQPEKLQRVQVRLLWEHHFRVNVLVGADPASVTVAHSFFVVTDGGDNILASTPAIAKQY